jgi:APA family basic amino acid/polyamine antiporter
VSRLEPTLAGTTNDAADLANCSPGEPRGLPLSLAPAVGSGRLGLRSGVGLVMANMIGAGVFLSAGYMAQDMGPYTIMLSWVFGAGLALCGVRTYAAIASFVETSGGEYRYLSDLLHPAVGYFAGWASLLLGFAAPVAIDAFAIGAFLNTLIDGPDPRITGALVIVALTVAHALHMVWSKWTQNLLVVVKASLVLGFAALGLIVGAHALPTWSAPNATGSFPVQAFFENQFWIAFAFSGWNAAIYAAGDFRKPGRHVPKAMIIGCSVVAVIYLLINWVFVANLTPEQASAVLNHEATRITLGHLVAQDLLGPLGGTLMSVFAIIAFTSAMSAMTLVGPRVYSAMARDGFLPRMFQARDGTPPTSAVVLQGLLALGLLFTYSVLQAVESASAILLVFSGLVAVSLFVVWRRRPEIVIRKVDLVAASIYILSVLGILWYGFQGSVRFVITLAGVFVIGLIGYLATERWKRRQALAAAGGKGAK